MLRPEELLEARKKVPVLVPSLGEKCNFGTAEPVENSQLNAYLSSREKLLAATRVKMLGAILKGVWHEDRKEAEIEEKAGNSLMHRGHTIESKIYLYPEEALYLIDIGSLELFYNGIPMSLQKSYFVLLNNTGVTLDQYRVYNHLSVLGYKISRFSDSMLTKQITNCDETEYSRSVTKGIPIIVEKDSDDSKILELLRGIGPQKTICNISNRKGNYIISHPNKRKPESFCGIDDNLVVRILSCEDPVPHMVEMSNMASEGNSTPVLYAIVHPDTISFFLSTAVNIPIIM